MINLIKHPVRSSKSFEMIKHNKFMFEVDIRLSKPQIKTIVQTVYGIERNSILAVNTHITPLQQKRVTLQKGYKPRYKRAIVTLKKGQPKLFEKPDNKNNQN